MEQKSYITIYKPISGYKAILMTKFDGGEHHEIEQIGWWTHITIAEAIGEAKQWSEATGIPYCAEEHASLTDLSTGRELGRAQEDCQLLVALGVQGVGDEI